MGLAPLVPRKPAPLVPPRPCLVSATPRPLSYFPATPTKDSLLLTPHSTLSLAALSLSLSLSLSLARMSSSAVAAAPTPIKVELLYPARSLPSRRNRCGDACRVLRRRDLAAGGVALSVSCALASPAVSVGGMEKLPFKQEGYNFWTWKDRKIHYVVQGSGPPILLIHGFGASAFHWRYNIPELAKSYTVYAIDLLGFGWSEKALVDYDAAVWRDQVADFLTEKVKEPAVLVGNSLGAFTALITAADFPEQVSGVVLLNSAGQFGSPNAQVAGEEESALKKFLLKPLKEALQRIILGFLFWQSKQPARVKSVLKSVYINPINVDDYLIESITKPAADPNAGEVYYRLMSGFMLNQSKYTLDSVLRKLPCPLLLIWGDLDPWVGPAKANRIKEFYPNTSIVNLQAGHCPHDEVPELVNKALIDWLSSLKAKTQLQAV